MKKLLKRIFLIFIFIFVLSLGLLWILNERELSIREESNCNNFLSDSQITYIKETFRLKNEFGKKIWPGINSANIPIIVYNNCNEFLIGLDSVDEDWEKIENDEFSGGFYYRRKLTEQKAFAVLVDRKWACKMGELNQMNFEFLNGIRQEFPPILAQLFPYFLAEIKPDQYIVSLLHEMFHAYQAMHDSVRFEKIQSLYRLEQKYPYEDSEFIELWNKEGSLLSEAFSINEKSKIKEKVKEFLQIRKQRREMFNFSDELKNFERELEWLEGLAKYAEIRFYELASEESSEIDAIKYQKGLPHWQMEFDRLRKNLGEQNSDFRFYLSGMAQAKILDILYPDWKNGVLQKHIFLEELLEKYSSN